MRKKEVEKQKVASTDTIPLYAAAWGWNANGRAGNVTEPEIRLPRQIQKSKDFNYISCAAGKHHNLLVTTEGNVHAFGENRKNQLGFGSEFTSVPLKGVLSTHQSCPKAVTPSGSYEFKKDLKIIDVAAGGSCSYAREQTLHEGIKSVNGFKELLTRLVSLLRKYPESTQIARVYAIVRHELFNILKASKGQLLCWGDGPEGQLGLGEFTFRSAYPQPIRKLGHVTITQVSSGENHVLAICSNGYLYSWGQGRNGKLGHGDFENRDFPEKVKFFTSVFVVSCSAGDEHSAVITISRASVASGLAGLSKPSTVDSVLSSTGDPSSLLTSSVTDPRRGTEDADDVHYEKGRVSTFGRGAHGRLGNGFNRNMHTPVPVSFLKLPSLNNCSVLSVSCGGAHTLVLLYRLVPKCLATPLGIQTVVVAFGYGRNGQLGTGDTVDSFVPVKCKLPKSTIITEISAGRSWSMCKSVDGKLFTFGKGLRGQLGQAEHKFSLAPREVDSFGSHLRLSSGYAHNLSIVVPKKTLNIGIIEQYAQTFTNFNPFDRDSDYIKCKLSTADNTSGYLFDCVGRMTNPAPKSGTYVAENDGALTTLTASSVATTSTASQITAITTKPSAVTTTATLTKSGRHVLETKMKLRFYCATCNVYYICIHCIKVCHKSHRVFEISYKEMSKPGAFIVPHSSGSSGGTSQRLLSSMSDIVGDGSATAADDAVALSNTTSKSVQFGTAQISSIPTNNLVAGTADKTTKSTKSSKTATKTGTKIGTKTAPKSAIKSTVRHNTVPQVSQRIRHLTANPTKTHDQYQLLSHESYFYRYSSQVTQKNSRFYSKTTDFDECYPCATVYEHYSRVSPAVEDVLLVDARNARLAAVNKGKLTPKTQKNKSSGRSGGIISPLKQRSAGSGILQNKSSTSIDTAANTTDNTNDNKGGKAVTGSKTATMTTAEKEKNTTSTTTATITSIPAVAHAPKVKIPACRCSLYLDCCRMIPMIPEVPGHESEEEVQRGTDTTSTELTLASTSDAVTVSVSTMRAQRQEDYCTEMQLKRLFSRQHDAARRIQRVALHYLKYMRHIQERKVHALVQRDVCRRYYKNNILGAIWAKLDRSYAEFRERQEQSRMAYEDQVQRKYMYYAKLQSAIIGIEALSHGIRTLFGSISAMLPRVADGVANAEEWRPSFAFSWHSLREQQLRLHPLRRINVADLALLTQHLPRYQQPGFYCESHYFDLDVRLFLDKHLRDAETERYNIEQRELYFIQKEEVRQSALLALERLNKIKNASKIAIQKAANINKPPPAPPSRLPPRQIIVANIWRDKIERRQKHELSLKLHEKLEDLPFNLLGDVPISYTSASEKSQLIELRNTEKSIPTAVNRLRRRHSLTDPMKLYRRLTEARSNIYLGAFGKRRNSMPVKLEFLELQSLEKADLTNYTVTPVEVAVEQIKDSLEFYKKRLQPMESLQDALNRMDTNTPHNIEPAVLEKRDKIYVHRFIATNRSLPVHSRLPAEISEMLLNNNHSENHSGRMERRHTIGEPERLKRQLDLVLRQREVFNTLVAVSAEKFKFNRRRRRSFDYTEFYESSTGLADLLGYANEPEQTTITMTSLRHDKFTMEGAMVKRGFCEPSMAYIDWKQKMDERRAQSNSRMSISAKQASLKRAQSMHGGGGSSNKGSKRNMKSFRGISSSNLSTKNGGAKGGGTRGGGGVKVGRGARGSPHTARSRLLEADDEHAQEQEHGQGYHYEGGAGEYGEEYGASRLEVWQEYYAEDGTVYYYNKETGVSAWEMPYTYSYEDPESGDYFTVTVQIESQYQDEESGSWYWYNNATQESYYC